jgi:hypothetical protein
MFRRFILDLLSKSVFNAAQELAVFRVRFWLSACRAATAWRAPRVLQLGREIR